MNKYYIKLDDEEVFEKVVFLIKKVKGVYDVQVNKRLLAIRCKGKEGKPFRMSDLCRFAKHSLKKVGG